MHFDLLQSLCLIIVCIAAVVDFRTRKIPNWLTFPGTLLALILQYIFQSGWQGVLWGAAGWIVGALITLVSRLLPLLIRRYRQDAIGFGDIKLMALVGSYLGPYQILVVFFFFCVFYGTLSLLRVASVIPWSKMFIIGWGTPTAYELQAEEKDKITQTLRSHIPLAPAIALGTLCAIVFFPPTLAP